jgi:hypothetical protein
MPVPVRGTLGAFVLLLSTFTPLVALAQNQTASAGDIALARSLGLEGVQLAEAGNCAAAIDKFQRAEALYHAPTILVRLGECQVATGKVVTGTENLQRVVRESLPPKAPKAFVDAQARAQKSLDAALPKVAKLKIHVDAPQGVQPTVKLDGEPISLAALDVDRPADPGPHQVEASATGFKVARVDTMLAEGGSGSASLRLEPDAMAGAAPAQGMGPMAPYPPGQGPPPAGYGPPGQMQYPPPPPGAEAKGSSSKTLGFVLIGVGGVGVAVGSIFGAMALSKRSAIDDSGLCSPKSNCQQGAQGDIDSMKSSATVSTVGFAVGGGALAVGLIVLLTSGKSQPAAEAHATTWASVKPLVGPRSLGFEGSF